MRHDHGCDGRSSVVRGHRVKVNCSEGKHTRNRNPHCAINGCKVGEKYKEAKA